MKRKNKVPVVQPKLHWRTHDLHFTRVWNDGWYGDQFELLNPAEFSQLKLFAGRFGWSLEEAGDDD